MNRERFWLLIRYAVAGALGAMVQTGALYVWVSVLGFRALYLFGAIFGFLLALVITFLLQKYWTFRDHSHHRTSWQIFMYSIVALINVGINIGLLALTKFVLMGSGIDFFAGWYLVAQVFIVAFASVVSFTLNYFFTFSRTSNRTEEALESPPLA